MTERQGVEIDYCPKCRGVWLDRGELDKILERSAQEFAQPAAPAPAPAPTYAQPPPPASGSDPRHGDRRYSDDKRYDDDRKYHEKRRKKNFFEELFD